MGIAVLVDGAGVLVDGAGVLLGGTDVKVAVTAGSGVLLGKAVCVSTVVEVAVKVGVSVTRVPVGVAVNGVVVRVGVEVGTLVVLAASARAITSTSPRPAALPLTELN